MGKAAEKKKSGVLICGAYGMRNAGDEAVLDAILAEMRSIDPDMPVTVLSRSPEETKAVHGAAAIHSFSVPRVLRAMRGCALYISGGGSLIQDVTSSRSLWYYLWTLSAARRRGCRVMMYGCGVGPVDRPFNRRLAGRVINKSVDAITLREEASLDTLRALGVTRPETVVAAEPALSLSGAEDAEMDALFARFGMAPGGNYFCVCVRRWPGMERKAALFARAAEHAWEDHGLTPVFLSVNAKQDAESATAAAALLKEHTPRVLVTEGMGTRQVIGFLARMRAVLAMRLHALIFAASQGVPVIGVSYDPKVAGFLDYIGQTNGIDFSALERAEQLYPLIDTALAADRAALRRAADRLRAIEGRNTEVARKLLERGTAG